MADKEVTIETCRVTLLPHHTDVVVAKGSILHDAIAQAGVPLAVPCGGQGRCGRCLVIVRRGRVRRRSVARLTPGNIAQGYALACQTIIESDLIVFVPSQEDNLAYPEGPKSSELAAPQAISCSHDRPAWVIKKALSIAPPTLDDNTTDWDRVQRQLAQIGIRTVTTRLPVLKRLSSTLRQGAWTVTAVIGQGTSQETDTAAQLLDILPRDRTQHTLGLAIDIGTTSNVVYLADLGTRQVVDHASGYNGQISCGEDVISRIVYAKRPGGLDHLQELVLQTINRLIDTLLRQRNVRPDDIYWVTVAGNPTMMHLFLGLPPESIRLEPYIPTVNQPVPLQARELGLHVNPEAIVDCLPGVGAYVGADITAGVLCSGIAESEEVTLFIDVGTNGEIVVGNRDWLISCACSAGPAFEGSGVVSGMRAMTGAIEEVWINPRNVEPTIETIGQVPPRGICGSGMISLLGEMFITGVIDKSGHLDRKLNTPRIRIGEQGPEYVIAWAQETADQQRDIVITEVDIGNLMRAKAAIYAGMSVLIESVGLAHHDIERVLIGGAFGKYIDIEKAIAIGLLPDLPWEKFQYLGNTSVKGANLALLCREHREMITEIASKMTYLELSADNRFMDAFMSALFLPHTDIDRFPSVKAKLQANEEGAT